ncbi:metallopeptidase [Chloropicon primus]|uniref:Metallopeptidase n=2 Tax=Chloropicon primus TaxID=1764295 RepID=A0A5B8MI38_9CHLO|nr:metallopeptidase [Chloropicon primus]UPQ98935.1 metallopeptidase [Chloropicon primus]|eukprot:QDZ19724.1 metallopeptidase [Chloropicon primus]
MKWLEGVVSVLAGPRAVPGRSTPLGRLLGLRTKYTDSSGYTHFGKRGELPIPGRGAGGGRGGGAFGYLVGGAVVVGGATTYVSHLETIPYTNRRHFVLISPDQERALGSKMYQDLLAQQRKAGKLLPQGHKLTRLVKGIGSKIAKEAEDLSDWGGKVDHMKKLKWEFNLVDSPEVNAFVLPGGKVVVYTGLFGVLKSKEELAMVLAHEIAHTVARHNAEKITQQMTSTVLAALASLALGADFVSTPLILGLQLPYSRQCENEADAIGLQLMARACFAPQNGPKAMSRLSGEGNAMPEFLSTHPHSETRVSNLKKELGKASEVYESKCLLGGFRARFF